MVVHITPFQVVITQHSQPEAAPDKQAEAIAEKHPAEVAMEKYGLTLTAMDQATEIFEYHNKANNTYIRASMDEAGQITVSNGYKNSFGVGMGPVGVCNNDCIHSAETIILNEFSTTHDDMATIINFHKEQYPKPVTRKPVYISGKFSHLAA